MTKPSATLPRLDSVIAIRMTAGLLCRMGLDAKAIWPNDPIAELASNRAVDQNLKLIDVARECALASGYTRAELRNPFECIRAAFSGVAFASTMQSLAGAVMLSAWASERDTSRIWTTEGRSKSFKGEARIGLGIGGSLSQVPRGGSAEHAGSPGETSPTQAIKRYGRQLKIDEQDILDDNLGLIQQQFEDAGAAARRTPADIAYALLISNPTMPDGTPLFHADHGNTAASALSISSVATGRGVVSGQTVGGKPLHLKADVLIVGTDLEDAAYTIARSLVLGNEVPLRVVVEPRLNNDFTDPASGIKYTGSSTRWHLASSKQRTIEVSYLNGRTEPSLREYALTGGEFGMGFDTVLDVGAVVLDHRGLYRGNL